MPHQRGAAGIRGDHVVARDQGVTDPPFAAPLAPRLPGQPVDDIQAAVTQVTTSGGKVLGEPMEIPGVGQYVAFLDTENNRVSMLQPIPGTRHAA